MIKTVENKYDAALLWSESFGDTEQEALYFSRNLRHGKCIGLYKENTLVSMLYLVDCTLQNDRCSYVYAACTGKKYRGRGYMSDLLKYCKETCKNGFCLVPADESLAEYYKSQSICKVCSISDISFDETDEINEYLFDGCRLREPYALFYGQSE